MKSLKPKNIGLSILEVVVSIAILSVLLASMGGIFSSGYRYYRNIKMQSIAIFLAQEKMEDCFDPESQPLSIGTDTEEPVTDFDDFKRVLTISQMANHGSDKLMKVQATVSWKSVNSSGASFDRSVTFSTLVTEY